MEPHSGHLLVALAVLAFAAWIAVAARGPGPVVRDADGPPVRTLAAASVVAGAAHAWATPHHVTETALYGSFFIIVTLGQFLFAGALLRHRVLGAPLLVAGVFANAAIVATWVVSRTVGLPVGPHRIPEAVGAVDLAAAAAEMLLIGLAAVWLVLRTDVPRPDIPVPTVPELRSAFPR